LKSGFFLSKPEIDPVAQSLSQDIDIIAETQIKNTESKERVASAVSNLFKDHGELRVEENRVQFASNNLESLRFIKDQFRDRQVRAAARRLLLLNKADSESTYLLLNKQAATVSIAALCDDPRESALGPIVLRLRSPRLQDVIDWITAGFVSKPKEGLQMKEEFMDKTS
jgi:predicted RNA binding protein with dsRBD fold (UPF0201 family)